METKKLQLIYTLLSDYYKEYFQKSSQIDAFKNGDELIKLSQKMEKIHLAMEVIYEDICNKGTEYPFID